MEELIKVYQPSIDKIAVMTIDDIKALVAADESRTLELKKSTGELKDERLYPEQPKHPKWQYRLTEAAKEWETIN